MKIIDLLNNIENDEIEDGTIFEVIGDFFYKLIVINKNLYCINEMTKQLEILDSKYIGRFDNRQYEIVKLSNKVEEEKKIPEKLYKYMEKEEEGCYENILRVYDGGEYEINEDMSFVIDKINSIIDYLKSKGDE